MPLNRIEEFHKKDKYEIDLKPIIFEKRRLLKYITFDGIRKDSFMRYEEQEMHKRLKKRDNTYGESDMYKQEHFLDLTIANTSYLFNLDAQVELGHVYQLELLESTD
jgi:hypothetical protein